MTRLTVIIPVYRTSDTLDACVRSVLEQQVPGMEIILVDDGSPDTCPRQCDQWALAHPCIQAIHQQNRGLSAARNAALDIARGQYIAFADSDDCLAPHTLLPCVQWLETHPDTDIIEFPVISVDSASQQWQRLKETDTHGGEGKIASHKSYTSMPRYWVEGKAYTHSYAWNKVYRAKLWHGVRYPEGKVFEDMHTLPLLLDHCRKLVCVQGTPGYLYTHNTQGITAQARHDKIHYGSLLQASLNAWRRYAPALDAQDGDSAAKDSAGKNHTNKDCSGKDCSGKNRTGKDNATKDRAAKALDLYYMQLLNIQIQSCYLSGLPPVMPYRKVRLRAFPPPMLAKWLLLRLTGLSRAVAITLWAKRIAHNITTRTNKKTHQTI